MNWDINQIEEWRNSLVARIDEAAEHMRKAVEDHAEADRRMRPGMTMVLKETGPLSVQVAMPVTAEEENDLLMAFRRGAHDKKVDFGLPTRGVTQLVFLDKIPYHVTPWDDCHLLSHGGFRLYIPDDVPDDMAKRAAEKWLVKGQDATGVLCVDKTGRCIGYVAE